MIQALKEHLEEIAVDIVLKRVIPSVIIALSARLAVDFHMQGHVFFHPKSVQAVTALAILAAHYAIHLWELLKAKAAEAGKEKPK